MYVYIYIYIYTHIKLATEAPRRRRSDKLVRTTGARRRRSQPTTNTANPPTNIVDFRGFASSAMLFLQGEILMSIGDFPESLRQAVLSRVQC